MQIGRSNAIVSQYLTRGVELVSDSSILMPNKPYRSCIPRYYSITLCLNAYQRRLLTPWIALGEQRPVLSIQKGRAIGARFTVCTYIGT